MLGRVTPLPSNPCPHPLTGVPTAALAVQAREGVEEAMAELFRRSRDRARRAAASWCDRGDVDDAIADGFARAFGSLAHLRDPAAVEAWILRCVTRSAIDLSRRAARQRPGGAALDLDSRSASCPSAADVASAAADRRTVMLALAEVPDHYRRVLYLRYHRGLSIREMAVELAMPEGTLRRQCMEALRMLEQSFLRCHLRPASGRCVPITSLLCRGARHQLSHTASRRVAAHLQFCRRCRERRDELGELVAGLGVDRRQPNRSVDPLVRPAGVGGGPVGAGG